MNGGFTLPAMLALARKERGLSQKELGRRVGLPQSHISQIENGRVDVRVSTLTELARALGLEPTLVPLTVLPTLKALLAQKKSPRAEDPIPAYRLDEEEEEEVG